MQIKFKTSVKKYFTFADFLKLIFPKVCNTCGKSLVKGEELLCTKCVYEIPSTNFHLNEKNEMAKLFYGQIQIEYATALFFFNKGSNYRKLIHNLKYNNRPDIGVEMGRIYGVELKKSVFEKCDILVPIPLHPLKLRKRGYNQSEKISEGISEILEIPIDNENLIRTVNTQTQTKKNIEERRKNVKSVFKIKDENAFEGKHILLIDDVVTTGSTLTAAATELLKLPNVKVSVATLAFA